MDLVFLIIFLILHWEFLKYWSLNYWSVLAAIYSFVHMIMVEMWCSSMLHIGTVPRVHCMREAVKGSYQATEGITNATGPQPSTSAAAARESLTFKRLDWISQHSLAGLTHRPSTNIEMLCDHTEGGLRWRCIQRTQLQSFKGTDYIYGKDIH